MKRLPLCLVFSLFLAACASPPTEEVPTPDPGPTLALCPETMVIENFAFSPASCRVAPGTTITFLNRDQMTHTATSSLGAPVDFDTGTLEAGQSAEITFTEAGEYPYYCTTHPDMTASITVAE